MPNCPCTHERSPFGIIVPHVGCNQWSSYCCNTWYMTIQDGPHVRVIATKPISSSGKKRLAWKWPPSLLVKILLERHRCSYNLRLHRHGNQRVSLYMVINTGCMKNVSVYTTFSLFCFKSKQQHMASVFLSTISLVFLLFAVASTAKYLSPNYYASSCPGALSTVKRAVKTAVAKEKRMGASLLRLHFHDCFVLVSRHNTYSSVLPSLLMIHFFFFFKLTDDGLGP